MAFSHPHHYKKKKKKEVLKWSHSGWAICYLSGANEVTALEVEKSSIKIMRAETETIGESVPALSEKGSLW